MSHTCLCLPSYSWYSITLVARYVIVYLPERQSPIPVQWRRPWPISKIFRGFYTPNYPTLVFHMSCDSHHRLRSYCWETARPSIRPNFSVHPVGKTMRWIKKWMATFDGLDDLYHHAKFGEDRTMRAGCRCENVAFFLSRSACVRRVHSSFEHCVAVYRPISTRISAFFSWVIALPEAL